MNEKTELSRETVIRLARQAVNSGDGSELSGDAIERFAQLVFLEAASPSSKSTKEAERLTALLERLRERCAETAEGISSDYPESARDTAEAIRAIELDVAVRQYLASSSIKEDGERAEPCRYADQCNEEGACANGCGQRRADFEVWAASHGATEFGRNPNRPDEYQMAGLQGAWLRWQSERGANIIQEIEREFVPLEDLPSFIRRLQDQIREARDALREIALAGMAGSGQESEEGMKDWHARRAWEFIGIAARALSSPPSPLGDTPDQQEQKQ